MLWIECKDKKGKAKLFKYLMSDVFSKSFCPFSFNIPGFQGSLLECIRMECLVYTWNAQVTSRTYALSLNPMMINSEVSPLGSAWACSRIFCCWAARVLSSMSRPIITSSCEVWYAERSVLLMLKAGFAMSSVPALSSFPIEKTNEIRRHPR